MSNIDKLRKYQVYPHIFLHHNKILVMRSISTRSLRTINLQEMKGWQKTYRQHKLKIEQIQSRHIASSKKMKTEQERIAQALRRSKQISKKFNKQEEQGRRLNLDRKMVQNLIDINKKPRIRSQIKKLKLKLDTLPSRSVSRQKQYAQSQITQQNQRLAKSIVSSSNCVKQYKKKLKSQIKQYIKIRTHLQKLKPVENQQKKDLTNRRKKLNRLEQLIQQKTEQIQKNKAQVQSHLPQLVTENQLKTSTLPL